MSRRTPAAETHPTSWYTLAHTRLAELERRLARAQAATLCAQAATLCAQAATLCAQAATLGAQAATLCERRLARAQLALRSRLASEGDAAASAASAAGGDAEASRWAAGAAGVRLTQPTPMQSAYGLHAPPTHMVPRYANTLDWICVDGQRLEVVRVAPRPPLQELTRDVAMPSAEWPSDHFSLCCDLAWRI